MAKRTKSIDDLTKQISRIRSQRNLTPERRKAVEKAYRNEVDRRWQGRTAEGVRMSEIAETALDNVTSIIGSNDSKKYAQSNWSRNNGVQKLNVLRTLGDKSAAKTLTTQFDTVARTDASATSSRGTARG